YAITTALPQGSATSDRRSFDNGSGLRRFPLGDGGHRPAASLHHHYRSGPEPRRDRDRRAPVRLRRGGIEKPFGRHCLWHRNGDRGNEFYQLAIPRAMSTEPSMPSAPTFHPVYKSMNKPLTIWGADRSLFFLAMIMGAATFNFFGSLLGGILM